MTREWMYWTRNKLQILEDYLPAFNSASKKSKHRLYLDLMAGQPDNIEKGSGKSIDGSARIAMSAQPGFTHLSFIERDPSRARLLHDDMAARYPGDTRGRVYEGDCNVAIDTVLNDLKPFSLGAAFAFLDQQGAEITWSTIEKVAHFRTGTRKTELWTLFSPYMIARGVKGHHGDVFAGRVDALFGTDLWRSIQAARDHDVIGPDEYREEMSNLFRWLLENRLNYGTTVRIPMKMPSGAPAYDMVFATDHPVGEKIMTGVYQKAAEREPEMMKEVRARAINTKSQDALFDVSGDMLTQPAMPKWTNTPTWDPEETAWFAAG